MTVNEIATDYLVVGAGATAMAFVDTLLSESDADIVMVDRRYRPGGHWNDAYPFVRLHQPSAFYGVNSRELSSWSKDTIGLNAGFYGLASGSDVLSHFEQVMLERFLPSRRVRWLPMSDYSIGADGAHRVMSLTNGEETRITVRKKFVNGTHAQTAIPATVRRHLHTAQPATRHSPPLCRLHGGRLGQDRHGQLPMAPPARRIAVTHPLDHAARRLAPQPRQHAAGS
jgi:hypothetical protein